jgi:hypothetical protein
MYNADPGSDFWFAVVILIIAISYWAAGKTNGVAFFGWGMADLA